MYFNLFGYSPLALHKSILGPCIRKPCALSPTQHYKHQETKSVAGRGGRKLEFKIHQFGTSWVFVVVVPVTKPNFKIDSVLREAQ